MVHQEMASSLHTSQGADTVVDCSVAEKDTTTTDETINSSIKFQVGGQQPNGRNVSFRTLGLFFRKRIVLLALSIALSIIIITMTIVGVLVSSNREQVEMIEAKMNSTHSHSGMNHRHESNSSSEVVSTSNNDFNLFPSHSVAIEDGTSGSGHSSEETYTNESSDLGGVKDFLFGNQIKPVSFEEFGLDLSGDTSSELTEEKWQWHSTKSSNIPLFIGNDGNEIFPNER